MGTYIYQISLIALIGSVITVLCPQKFSKYLSFVVGIILILSIITPLSTFIVNTKEKGSEVLNIPETDIKIELDNRDLNKIAAEALASSIVETISGKYGNKENDTKIIITTNEGENFTVTYAEIYINNCDFDIKLAEKYLANLYGFDFKIYEK